MTITSADLARLAKRIEEYNEAVNIANRITHRSIPVSRIQLGMSFGGGLSGHNSLISALERHILKDLQRMTYIVMRDMRGELMNDIENIGLAPSDFDLTNPLSPGHDIDP